MKASLVSKRAMGAARILPVLFATAFLLCLRSGPSEAARVHVPQAVLEPSQMQREQCLNAGQARSSARADTGRMRFVGTDPGEPIRPPAALAPTASAEEAARGYLAACGSLFGLSDQAGQLSVERQRTADRGRSVLRFQQTHRGVPVFGGELIVQLDSSKNILSVSGETLPDISVETTPSVTAEAARETALQVVAKNHRVSLDALSATPPELWVYNPTLVGPGGDVTTLVWRTEITPRDLLPIRELVLVDAQRGSVALSFNQIDTAKERRTFTAGNVKVLPGTPVCNESNPLCTGGDAHAVAAHIYGGDTYDFYFNTLGRDSIDNHGLPMSSTVHYDTGYKNAFWNGKQMVYGDGYGFPLADDVVAHELTHGVTQYESNLYYYYQSGAINESLSDVFGELLDLTNGKGNDNANVRWLMGEDVTGLGAMRSLKDPTAFQHPDKMTSPYYVTTTCIDYSDKCDNGGVHYNSGVNNKAAYLMTDGGLFNGQVITGIGIPKVAKIYYEVQTTLLVSGSDYADLYEALYQGCLNLVGTSGITSGDCQQVRNATKAVEMDQQPESNYNPDAPICPSGQTPNNVFFDNLEGGATQWLTGKLEGTNRWYYGSPYGTYAHSGEHFLYADDYPAVPADSFVKMANAVTLPANAFLHFAQAYGFEDPDYDGGVLEYSANAGATWIDAGSLFMNNGYNGTLEPTNPLGKRAAFVGDSHGYITTRLNLSSLAGKSILFRWRLGVDVMIFDRGWWLDDVRIYTCGAQVLPGNFGKSSPANGATRRSTNPQLKWTVSTGADSYEYCYDTTNDDTCNASWKSTGSTEAAVSGLSAGATYFWQVRARNASGTVEADGEEWWNFGVAADAKLFLPLLFK